MTKTKTPKLTISFTKEPLQFITPKDQPPSTDHNPLFSFMTADYSQPTTPTQKPKDNHHVIIERSEGVSKNV